MDAAAIEPFFATLQRADPEPTTELEYGSDFQLLVAVILSAQATDTSVNQATRAAVRRSPARPSACSPSARTAWPATSGPSACTAARRRT